MVPARIGFLLGQPTQFDAPFFRHAHAIGRAMFTVLYVAADASSSVYDAELGCKVDWGIDLLSGYDHRTLPASGRLRWLWNELRRERYDWVIINGYTRLPYLAAALIARRRGIRTALRIDSVLFNARGWPMRARKRIAMAVLARGFDRFLATGTLAREYLVHFGVAPGKISLFPYVVDAERFRDEAEKLKPGRAALRAQHGVPETARVILSVAKFNARESPWDLLAALEVLNRPDVWAVLVGDGGEIAALRARVEARALERVVFAGYVPHADLVRYYAMADLFVHAAADEPWGVSVHEAIGCGLPVVASSRVGAARDLVLQGRNGFVYAWGDPKDLCAKLAAVIDTLGPESVASANREVLERWNYVSTWNGLLEVCT